MEVSWLILLVSAAVLAAIFLLLVVCVDCSNHGPMAHIPQWPPPEEDEFRNSEFLVIRPGATLPVPAENASHPSPIPSVRKPEAWRPATPTETESIPSYENSGTPPARPESEDTDPGYILVLPENDPEKSRPFTPGSDEQNSSSSSDNLHEYVNVESPGSNDYLNVDPSPNNAGSSSDNDDDEDDDDGDDCNYVNQFPINYS